MRRRHARDDLAHLSFERLDLFVVHLSLLDTRVAVGLLAVGRQTLVLHDLIGSSALRAGHSQGASSTEPRLGRVVLLLLEQELLLLAGEVLH